MVLAAVLRGGTSVVIPPGFGFGLAKKQDESIRKQTDIFCLPWDRFRNPETKDSIFLKQGRGSNCSLPVKVQTEKSKQPSLKNNDVNANSKKQCGIGKAPSDVGTGLDKDTCRSRNNAMIEASDWMQTDYPEHGWMGQNLVSDERRINALVRARRLRMEKDIKGEEPIMMKKNKALHKAKRLKEQKEEYPCTVQDDITVDNTKNAFDIQKPRPLPPIPTTDEKQERPLPPVPVTVEKQERPLPPVPTTVELKGRPLPPIPITDGKTIIEKGYVTKYAASQMRDMFVKYMDKIRLEIRHLERLCEAVREREKFPDFALKKEKQKLQHHATMLLLDVFSENEHIMQLERKDFMDEKSASALKDQQHRKLQEQRYRMEIMRIIKIKEAKLKLYKKKKDYMYDMTYDDLRASINLLREEREMINRARVELINHCMENDEEWQKSLYEDDLKPEDYHFKLDPETIKRRETLLKRTAKDVQREKLESVRKKDEEYEEKVRQTAEMMKKTNQDFYTHMAIRRETAEKNSKALPMNKSKGNEKEPMSDWLRKQMEKQHKKWEKLEKQYGMTDKDTCKKKMIQKLQTLKQISSRCHIKTPPCVSKLCAFSARAKHWASKQHRNIKRKVVNLKKAGAAKCYRFKKSVTGMKGKCLNARPVIIIRAKYGKVKIQLQAFSTTVKKNIVKMKRRVKSTVKGVKRAVKVKAAIVGRKIKKRVCPVTHKAMNKLNKWYAAYTKLMHPGPAKTKPGFSNKTMLSRGVRGGGVFARFFNSLILAMSFRNAKLVDFEPKMPEDRETLDWADVPLLIGFGRDKEVIREQRELDNETDDLPVIELLQGDKHNLVKCTNKSKYGPQLYLPYEYQLSRLPSRAEEDFLESRLDSLHARLQYKELTGEAPASSSESSISLLSVTSADFYDELCNESILKSTKAPIDDDNIESDSSANESEQLSDSLSSSDSSHILEFSGKNDVVKTQASKKYPTNRKHRKRRIHVKSGIRYTFTAGWHKKLRASKSHSRWRSPNRNNVKNRLSNKSTQRQKRKSKSRKSKLSDNIRKKMSSLVKTARKFSPKQWYQRKKNGGQLRAQKKKKKKDSTFKKTARKAKRQVLQREVDRYVNSLINPPLPMKLEVKPFRYKSDFSKLGVLLKKQALLATMERNILANSITLTDETKKYIRFVLRRKKFEKRSKCRNSTDLLKSSHHENQRNFDTTNSSTGTKISFNISKSTDSMFSCREKDVVKKKRKLRYSPRKPKELQAKSNDSTWITRPRIIFNLGKHKKYFAKKALAKRRNVRKLTMRHHERRQKLSKRSPKPSNQQKHIPQMPARNLRDSSSFADSEGSIQQEKDSLRQKKDLKKQQRTFIGSRLGTDKEEGVQQEKSSVQRHKSGKREETKKQKANLRDSSLGTDKDKSIKKEKASLKRHKSGKRKEAKQQKTNLRDSSLGADKEKNIKKKKTSLKRHFSRKGKETKKQKTNLRDSSLGADKEKNIEKKKTSLKRHFSRKRKETKKQKTNLRDSSLGTDKEKNIKKEKTSQKRHKSKKEKATKKQKSIVRDSSLGTENEKNLEQEKASLKRHKSKKGKETKKQKRNLRDSSLGTDKEKNIKKEKASSKSYKSKKGKETKKQKKNLRDSSSGAAGMGRTQQGRSSLQKHTSRKKADIKNHNKQSKSNSTNHSVKRKQPTSLLKIFRTLRPNKGKKKQSTKKHKIDGNSRKTTKNVLKKVRPAKQIKSASNGIFGKIFLRRGSKLDGKEKKHFHKETFEKQKSTSKIKNHKQQGKDTLKKHKSRKKEDTNHQKRNVKPKSTKQLEKRKQNTGFMKILRALKSNKHKTDEDSGKATTNALKKARPAKTTKRSSKGIFGKIFRREKSIKLDGKEKESGKVTSEHRKPKSNFRKRLSRNQRKFIREDNRLQTKKVSVKSRSGVKKNKDNKTKRRLARFRSSKVIRMARNGRPHTMKTVSDKKQKKEVSDKKQKKAVSDKKQKKAVSDKKQKKAVSDNKQKNAVSDKKLKKAVSDKKHSSKGKLKNHKTKRVKNDLGSATGRTKLRKDKKHRPDKKHSESKTQHDKDGKIKSFFKRFIVSKRSKTSVKEIQHNTKETLPVEKGSNHKRGKPFTKLRLSKKGQSSGKGGLNETNHPTKTHHKEEKLKGDKGKGLFGRLRFSKHSKDSNQDNLTSAEVLSSNSFFREKNVNRKLREMKVSREDNRPETEASADRRTRSKERGVAAFFKKIRSQKLSQYSTSTSEGDSSKVLERDPQKEDDTRPVTKKKTFRKKVVSFFRRLKKNSVIVDDIVPADMNERDDNSVVEECNNVEQDDTVVQGDNTAVQDDKTVVQDDITAVQDDTNAE